MPARLFRCRECGYPFKTAAEGWARNSYLMCPACGSDDVMIVVDIMPSRPVFVAPSVAPPELEEILEA